MTPTFAEVSKARYIMLTTFTKDGRPKPTAVGAAADGDRLLVHTEEDTWKVKRIRNTPRVTVAACDMRGRPKGEPVEAVAKVLDKAETADVQRAITKRYGPFGRLFDLYFKLSGVDKKSIGIELKAA
jgi:PPOX class probable F420-dependent enzyme